jgi:D-alanyl-D-alanine carboxypeptidase
MNQLARLTSALLLASVAAGAATAAPPPPAAGVCGTAVPAEGSQAPAAAAVLRLAKDWVQAINTADDAAFVAFVKARGPVLLDGPERWLQLRDNLRGIQLCGLKSAAADKVELWSFDPGYDSFAIMGFKPAAAEADKPEFVFLRGSESPPPGAARPARLALPALLRAIEARAAERTAHDQFAGAILVARNGRVLFQKAYGLADRAHRTPNRLDTQFRFGSMGKMFTIVSIMQLVEQGKIDLEAPIGRYLPDYPNRDIATKVTVANLLSHTGGTGDIFGPEFESHKATLRSTRDYVDLYGGRAPQFAPGARKSYSNFGFILLGRIVEQVSGLPYDDYIARNVFAPAGMASTGNRPESEILPRRAIPYMGAGARLKSAEETLPLNGTAAGGGYSTVGDFHRFVAGLTSHRLLRAETLQKLIHGGVKMADGKFAAFDFGGTEAGAGPFIGHGGGAPGMSGSLQHFLNSGVTVVVLANRDPGAAESIALFAAHRLPAK